MKEQVIEALKKVRPALQRDGGDIELVSVEENGVVKVRLKGACGSCPMSTMTLKMGVEKMLKQEVPDVKEPMVFPAGGGRQARRTRHGAPERLKLPTNYLK